MPARGPEVRASNVQAAASIANADNISQYKKKMFYRRLKVILIGTTALALLLAGCLLGFVLPASIHEKPSAGANVSSRADPSSGRLVGLNNSRPLSNISTENVTQNSSTTSFNLTKITSPITTISTTTTPNLSTTTSTPSTKMTTKWWLVKIHDQLSEVKRKHAQYRATSPTSGPRSSSFPETTSPSSVNKWWLRHWREHVENELQKNKLKNNTSVNTPRTSAILEHDGRSDDVKLLTEVEEVKNHLPGSKQNNHTSRPNVHRVTSYPRLNITTTAPSVIIRKV